MALIGRLRWLSGLCWLRLVLLGLLRLLGLHFVLLSLLRLLGFRLVRRWHDGSTYDSIEDAGDGGVLASLATVVWRGCCAADGRVLQGRRRCVGGKSTNVEWCERRKGGELNRSDDWRNGCCRNGSRLHWRGLDRGDGCRYGSDLHGCGCQRCGGGQQLLHSRG